MKPRGSVVALAAVVLQACARAASAPATAPPPTAGGPPPANDPGLQELTDAIHASSAVVVATATLVDDRAGLTHPPHEGDRTRVVLRVERVLHGAAAPGDRELWFSGGVLPDGTIGGSSEQPPSLTAGDRYIVFLRDAPGRTPIVKARRALLRIVRFGDDERVVDEYGRGIVADPQRGLRPLRKIAEAMRERSIAAAGEPGLRYVSQDRLEPSDVERASPLSEVLQLIARTGLALGPARR